jgi:hypothetical protein
MNRLRAAITTAGQRLDARLDNIGDRLAARRDWLVENLPAGLLARPGEWFLAVLCFLSGLTILTGAARPTSVALLLPEPIYVTWGACLVIGSASLACGLSSYQRSPGGWIVTRVPCYRLGLRLLGLSAGLYAVVVLYVAQLTAVFAAAITLSFAGMCGVRLLTLGNAR